MLQDIFVGAMCVIVAGVAVWGWWLDYGPDKSGSEEGEKEEQEEKKN